MRPATSPPAKFLFADLLLFRQRATIGPRRAHLRLIGQLIVPMCRHFSRRERRDSNRDLRRDRLVPRKRRLATIDTLSLYSCGFVGFSRLACAWLSQAISDVCCPSAARATVAPTTDDERRPRSTAADLALASPLGGEAGRGRQDHSDRPGTGRSVHYRPSRSGRRRYLDLSVRTASLRTHERAPARSPGGGTPPAGSNGVNPATQERLRAGLRTGERTGSARPRRTRERTLW